MTSRLADLAPEGIPENERLERLRGDKRLQRADGSGIDWEVNYELTKSSARERGPPPLVRMLKKKSSRERDKWTLSQIGAWRGTTGCSTETFHGNRCLIQLNPRLDDGLFRPFPPHTKIFASAQRTAPIAPRQIPEAENSFSAEPRAIRSPRAAPARTLQNWVLPGGI